MEDLMVLLPNSSQTEENKNDENQFTCLMNLKNSSNEVKTSDSPSAPSSLKRKAENSTLHKYFEVMKRKRKEKQKEALSKSDFFSLIETLPLEIIISILKYLNAVELCKVSRLNKRFLIIANMEEIWEHLCYERWISKNIQIEIYRDLCNGKDPKWKVTYKKRIEAERTSEHFMRTQNNFKEYCQYCKEKAVFCLVGSSSERLYHCTHCGKRWRISPITID